MSELLLVLYSRPGCHLCDEAKEALAPFVARYALRIEERNVPVGVLAGRKVFKFRLDSLGLERSIEAHLRARKKPTTDTSE